MATIIVETGLGVNDSNSYVSEADLITYATDRGLTLSGDTSVMLIQGMDYIEMQGYQGYKTSSSQSLQFPRTSVVIDNYLIGSTTIPQLLKDALCEVAISIDNGVNPLASITRETKREKVGVLEVEYAEGSREATHITAVANKLQKLLLNSSSINMALYA